MEAKLLWTLYDIREWINSVWLAIYNFDFKIRRDHGKISYEGRVSEAVDDKGLILGYISKIYGKNDT